MVQDPAVCVVQQAPFGLLDPNLVISWFGQSQIGETFYSVIGKVAY
jgi:hypothetical protein